MTFPRAAALGAEGFAFGCDLKIWTQVSTVKDRFETPRT